jgi:hypothetical protein
VYLQETWTEASPAARRERLFRDVPDLGARWRAWARTASRGDARLLSGPVVATRAVHDDFWRGPHADARLRSAAAEQSRACLEFTHAALSAWIVGADEARETVAEDDDDAGDSGDASRAAVARLDDALLRELARLVDERDAAGPRFFCGDLVDGACEQPCDWQRAFAERHDFACYGTLTHARVFVKDASPD